MPFLLQPGLGFKLAPGVSIADHRRALRAYLWQKSDGLCALCAQPIQPWDVDADHVVPRTKGGTDGVDNLQAAHPACNSRKNNRSNDEAIALIRSGIPYARNVKRRARPLRRRPMWTAAMVARLLGTTPEEAIEQLNAAHVTYVQLGRGQGGWRVRREDLERFIRSRQPDQP